MRIILSRKGFDASAGGVASPILPDGRLISLPIPDAQAPLTYGDWQVPDLDPAKLVHDLTKGKITAKHRMHLDPDLRHRALPTRKPDWRPIFGQHGAAAGHLLRQSVAPGDLFVFFGWFREVEMHQNSWRFKKDAPDLHVLHGWLKIAAIHLPLPDPAPEWMQQHPHFFGKRETNNMLYVASDNFTIDGHSIPGAGHFNFLKQDLILTKSGQNRGIWQLPTCFFPKKADEALTYHRKLSRWTKKKDHVILDSAKRGQEFVVKISRSNYGIQKHFENLIKTETLHTL